MPDYLANQPKEPLAISDDLAQKADIKSKQELCLTYKIFLSKLELDAHLSKFFPSNF